MHGSAERQPERRVDNYAAYRVSHDEWINEWFSLQRSSIEDSAFCARLELIKLKGYCMKRPQTSVNAMSIFPLCSPGGSTRFGFVSVCVWMSQWDSIKTTPAIGLWSRNLYCQVCSWQTHTHFLGGFQKCERGSPTKGVKWDRVDKRKIGDFQFLSINKKRCVIGLRLLYWQPKCGRPEREASAGIGGENNRLRVSRKSFFSRRVWLRRRWTVMTRSHPAIKARLHASCYCCSSRSDAQHQKSIA